MSQERKPAVDAAREFLHFVNDFGCDEAGFVSAVMRDHRTLQQSAMRIFWFCIEKWAEAYKSGNYDGRNEATCKLASKLVEAAGDNTYLPCI